MQYTGRYASPLGGMLLAADDAGLTGLWFEGQKHFARRLDSAHEEREIPLFDEVRRWLDQYFSGREPDFMPPLHLIGTAFEREVWDILRAIPYGETTTYGAIAAQLARQRGLAHMSAQAVGGAVGRNPISVIVPCHRVLGADGSLTGYAGGIERKRRLLALESH
ncbi:MAG: methylated-DNA--[protein]-cysteine S-methyltransferase [Clostridia bacterium]|nr:methylated-DNA--[protein]-cysteine S-methyltransferase [Clostridia bacterium]